jgi:hypothetical protein
MAYWGIAYALGPYYNKPWADFTEEELKETLNSARRTTETALEHSGDAAPVERALIRALERRYQSDRLPDTGDLRVWSDDYAAAMREVYAAFPDDLDVGALFAEAMMDRTPWQLWDLTTGEPMPDADTLETLAVLEQGLHLSDERDVPHPGLLHLYIHAMEMSPHPERALRAADALRELAPDAGHLLHMPSHIDILCGDYHAALVANARAIVADRKYMEREGPFNFYTLSRCHDYHFKLYAAMFPRDRVLAHSREAGGPRLGKFGGYRSLFKGVEGTGIASARIGQGPEGTRSTDGNRNGADFRPRICCPGNRRSIWSGPRALPSVRGRRRPARDAERRVRLSLRPWRLRNDAAVDQGSPADSRANGRRCISVGRPPHGRYFGHVLRILRRGRT